MSGMLQRLVQRARDPAIRGGSRVEPLLAVRYSPSSFAVHSHENEDTSLRQGERGNIPTSRSVPAPSSMTDHRPRTQPSPITAQAPLAQRVVAARGHDVVDQVRPRETAPQAQRDTADEHSRSRDALITPAPMASVADAPSRADATAENISVVMDTPIQTITETPVRAHLLEPLIHSQPSAPAQRYAASPRDASAMDGVQTRQEITISIGHIEIRGAPTQAAPKRAEFRPRISLDDFLGGRR